MLALSLLLATAPAVQVDARGLAELEPEQAAMLHGQLLERLLEAGYTLHPDAPLALSLEVVDDGLFIRVMGDGSVAEDLAPQGDREFTVVQLDAIHRSLALLAEVPAQWESEDLEDAIVVRIGSDAPELRAEVLRTLADERRTVLPAGTPGADWSLCAAQDEDGIRLALTPAQEECAEELERASPHADVEVAFSRAWNGARWPEDVETTGVEDPPEEQDADATAPSSPPRPLEAAPVPDTPEHPYGTLRLGIIARAGIAVRPALDGAYALGLSLGRTDGPVGTLEATALPSRGDVELRVVDTSLVATFGWQFSVTERLDLVPAVGGGSRIHTYWFPDEAATVAVDPEVQIPLHVRWRSRDWAHLGLRIAGAWSGRGRRHLNRGASIWARSAFRFEAGLEILFSIPFGRRS